MILPGPIPAKNFWSFTVYDNDTRSLLPTDQELAGLDSTLPGVRMNPDGGVTIWFGPKAPAGRKKNWIRTMQGKGYNIALRLYGPLNEGPRAKMVSALRCPRSGLRGAK